MSTNVFKAMLEVSSQINLNKDLETASSLVKNNRHAFIKQSDTTPEGHDINP